MTDTDQASARRTMAGTGEAYWFFDSLMVIRADQPGQPVTIEATVAPGGGAPPHVHADLDDCFYLVSGQLAMRCGEQAFAVSPGDYVALPHGVPHTFRVTGDKPAVMLQVHAGLVPAFHQGGGPARAQPYREDEAARIRA